MKPCVVCRRKSYRYGIENCFFGMIACRLYHFKRCQLCRLRCYEGSSVERKEYTRVCGAMPLRKLFDEINVF